MAKSTPLQPPTRYSLNMVKVTPLQPRIQCNLTGKETWQKKQQNLSLLPKRDVPTFSGNPLSFQPFILAFEHSIEKNTDDYQDRLYFIEQFTDGPAEEYS